MAKLSSEDITIEEFEKRIPPANMSKLINSIGNNTLSGKMGKAVFAEMFKNEESSEEIIEEQGLIQVSDESEIGSFVTNVIQKNPVQVEQYKSGKMAVVQYFVGQVMKLSKGKANPQVVQKMLKDKLDA